MRYKTKLLCTLVVLLVGLGFARQAVEPEEKPARGHHAKPSAATDSSGNLLEDWHGGGENNLNCDNHYEDHDGVRSVRLTYHIPTGQYGGFALDPDPQRPIDLSRAKTFTFTARADHPGKAYFCLLDDNGIWRSATFDLPSPETAEVSIPMASMEKCPFQDEGTDTSAPMSLKKCSALSINRSEAGKCESWIGPITFDAIPPYLKLYPAALKKYFSAHGKMALPEEGRKYFVQAEAMVGEKNYDSAVNCYFRGLETAPWYPQAHYNLSILLAEHQNDYANAIDEMKKYLELSPDAPDARAAQDKIYVWESKVQ